MFLATRVPARSVWPILPRMRPQGEVMPSMAPSEPFGLWAMSIEGEPDSSQYWVAIWPVAASWAMISGLAKKRPSPWESGMVWMSPGWLLENHGESVLVTRVWA
jgi:hypothetical protein